MHYALWSWLHGEYKISAGQCGLVILIETNCRMVLNAKVAEDDLPSERSVLQFVDAGQFLGKMQVASALTNSGNFELHTDATSRVGKKYVGQQVTTDDDQNLSCGCAVVASENVTVSSTFLLISWTNWLSSMKMINQNNRKSSRNFCRKWAP